MSTVAFRNICSDPVLAGVPSPEVLCSLGFLGWLGETFHEEMVGGTVCSRWAKTMIVSVAPFYYLQGFTKRMMKETCKFYFHMMHFERRFVGRHLSFLLMFLLFHVGETPSGQKIVVLSALYNKTNKNILKYQLYTIASNKIWRLWYLNNLFGIKLNYLWSESDIATLWICMDKFFGMSRLEPFSLYRRNR